MKIFKDRSAWDGGERRNQERVSYMRSQRQGGMGKHAVSNFRRRLLIYFYLVVFLSLAVGVELVFEIGSRRVAHQISESITSQLNKAQRSQFEMERVTKVLQRLQYRLVLIIAIVFILVIATMILFIRNIVEPLDMMAKAAARIADGHLNETVPIRNNDEIGEIGELINDLAINLQEILLHTWNSADQNITLLDNMYTIICAQKESCKSRQLEEDIEFVRQDIESLKEMVKAFDFYNVELSDGKVMAAENSDHKKN
jgi:methyl-accepting chemotaxis protein